MSLRRASLVLYILFVLHLQTNFSSVSSSVDTNHETLPISKPDVVGFEGNSQDLDVVIKRALKGGGGRGGSGGGGRSSSGGRGRPRGVVPVHTASGGGSHHSSGRRNLRGTVCAVGWLTLSVLAGLFLVR